MIRENEKLIFKISHCYAAGTADREDLYQEIVLQCWKAWPRFCGLSKEGTWLYRIALNTAITHQRKESRRPRVSGLDMPLALQTPDDHTGIDQEQAMLMYRMIAGMLPLERALLLLYFEDRPHAEIAEIMGISVSNVATRLGRIRNKLKQQAALSSVNS